MTTYALDWNPEEVLNMVQEDQSRDLCDEPGGEVVPPEIPQAFQLFDLDDLCDPASYKPTERRPSTRMKGEALSARGIQEISLVTSDETILPQDEWSQSSSYLRNVNMTFVSSEDASGANSGFADSIHTNSATNGVEVSTLEWHLGKPTLEMTQASKKRLAETTPRSDAAPDRPRPPAFIIERDGTGAGAAACAPFEIPVGEIKRRRIARNRESVRKCRERQRQEREAILETIGQLTTENHHLQETLATLTIQVQHLARDIAQYRHRFAAFQNT